MLSKILQESSRILIIIIIIIIIKKEYIKSEKQTVEKENLLVSYFIETHVKVLCYAMG